MKLFEHIFCKRKVQHRNFIIFSIFLNGLGMITVFYYLFLWNTYYLMIFLVSGAGGLIIETVGTKLSLWEYYNKEKPPAISFFGWGSAVTVMLWIINFFRLI